LFIKSIAKFITFIQTNRDNFRRAFAAATVHDIFNFMTVSVLLPLEVASKFLETITGALVQPLSKYSNSTSKVEILGVITRPLVDLVIQLEDIDILQGNTQDITGTNGSTSIPHSDGDLQIKVRIIRVGRAAIAVHRQGNFILVTPQMHIAEISTHEVGCLRGQSTQPKPNPQQTMP